MTYFFSGVFVLGEGSEQVAEALRGAFGGRVGIIDEPLPAAVVAFAADYDRFEPPPVFDDALVRFSQDYPNRYFVRLETCCWGGAIDLERGLAFRDGAELGREESEQSSVILPLFARADVRLATSYLPSLKRDWFSDKGDKHAAFDLTGMRLALEVARSQVGCTGDNPAVGCVIASNDRSAGWKGEGICDVKSFAATADGGRPHAEEQALAHAGEAARGATAYVTLEPCAKRTSGSTSCADLLIAAGVARVVIAAADPHPFARGVGVERLKAAGVVVECGLFEAEARAQNPEFFSAWG